VDGQPGHRLEVDVFPRSSLVLVANKKWNNAVGLVLKTGDLGVWVRLGNGVVVYVPESDLSAVEYMQGSNCPAQFCEEMKPWTDV
jgi:hypothetical protein